MRFYPLISGFLSLALLSFTNVIQAEALNPRLEAKHSFRAGVYLQNADFEVAVTRPPNTPDILNLEMTWALMKTKTARCSIIAGASSNAAIYHLVIMSSTVMAK